MSDFRCPRYWWDGSQWRCQNLPNDYLSSYDFDTYCTNKNRCLECPYMDSEVREKVAAYKKEVDERVEEHVEEQRREYEEEQRREYGEEQRREYEEEQRNKENDYSYRENNNTSSTTTYSSSDSSDTGCLSALFGLVFVVIGSILKLLWSIIKVHFLALVLPSCVAASLIGFASGVLAIVCVSVGLIPLAVVFVIITGIPSCLFWPYWAILMWQKIKKQLTWKGVCFYYGKWFLKGPFAYPELAERLNDNNSMPKVSKLLNKIIDWFKNTFKKKTND